MSALAASSGSGAGSAMWAVRASWSHVGSPFQVAVGAGLAAVYLLALGAGLDQAATLVVLAGAGISAAWPASGLAMFAVIMPMREPEVLVPIRFNAILAGAIAFGCILRLPVDRPRLRVHPGVALLVGYLIFSAVSILPVVSGHPAAWVPSALNALLRLTTGVVLFLSAAYLFRFMSPWPILALALVGSTLAALLALGDILNFLPFEAVTRGLVENTGSARASGAFADPNFLGLYAATAAVFALGVLMVAPRAYKLLLVPVVALLLICVVLTFSRGAYIGLAVGLLVLAARWDLRAALVLAIVIGVAAVTVYPVFLEVRQGGPLLPIDIFQAESQPGVQGGDGQYGARHVRGVPDLRRRLRRLPVRQPVLHRGCRARHVVLPQPVPERARGAGDRWCRSRRAPCWCSPASPSSAPAARSQARPWPQAPRSSRRPSFSTQPRSSRARACCGSCWR